MLVPSYPQLQHLWHRFLVWEQARSCIKFPANIRPLVLTLLVTLLKAAGWAFLFSASKIFIMRLSSAGAFDGLWWNNAINGVGKEQQSTNLSSSCSLSLKCEKDTSWSTLCMCPWRFLLSLLSKPRFSIVSNAQALQSGRMSCALVWCVRCQQNCQLCLSHCNFIREGFGHKAGFAGLVDTLTFYLCTELIWHRNLHKAANTN